MDTKTIKTLSRALFILGLCLFEIYYISTWVEPNINILPLSLIVTTTLARYLFYFFLVLGFNYFLIGKDKPNKNNINRWKIDHNGYNINNGGDWVRYDDIKHLIK